MTEYDPSFAVYLSFNGNCEEAFNYYQTCFGGQLSVQTLADTPHGKAMGKKMQTAVICASLRNEYFRLVGTDLTDEGRIVSGNNLSILIQCKSFTERTRLIDNLVGRNSRQAGDIDPLINITDRYSVRWILGVG